MIINT